MVVTNFKDLIGLKIKSCIYKVTSPIGKTYIGESKSIQSRYSKHKRIDKNLPTKLKDSYETYGFSEHVFEIIEFCQDLKELVDKEEIYIQSYDSTGFNGLNTRTKGSYKKEMSNSCKENIRKTQTGSNNSMFGKKPWNAGIKGENFDYSYLKVPKRKGANDYLKIIVEEYTLCGKYVRDWDSQTDASKELGISQSNIWKVIHGQRKHAGGRVFKYK